MTKLLSMNRRHFLQVSAAGALALTPGLLSGRALAQAALTVGFIYVGPKDDYGYNQAHAEGAAALKALPGVTIVEEENVPETVDVQKTMESMINLDGANHLLDGRARPDYLPALDLCHDPDSCCVNCIQMRPVGRQVNYLPVF